MRLGAAIRLPKWTEVLLEYQAGLRDTTTWTIYYSIHFEMKMLYTYPTFIIVYESYPRKDAKTISTQWRQVLRSTFHGIAVLYGTSNVTVIKSLGRKKIVVPFQKHTIERDLVAFLKLFAMLFRGSSARPIIIFSGHSWMFYVNIPSDEKSYCGHRHECKSEEVTSVLPISVVAGALAASGIRFHTIVFDSCNMASLEAVYELRKSAKYIMAHESYSYDRGLVSRRSLTYLGRPTRINEMVKLSRFAQFFLQSNKTSTMDLSIIRTKHLVPLVKHLIKNKFSRHDALSSNESAVSKYWNTHDLYVSFMNDARQTAYAKRLFRTLFRRLIPYYKQTRRQRMSQRKLPEKQRHHGMAFSKKPAKDVGHLERLLQLPV